MIDKRLLILWGANDGACPMLIRKGKKKKECELFSDRKGKDKRCNPFNCPFLYWACAFNIVTFVKEG